MGAVAIRLDDVHARTPLPLLKMLDQAVWRGKPVTLGIIAYPAGHCLGPDASRCEAPGRRSSASDPDLAAYLDAAISGGSEVALHGLTHADHKSLAGPAVPELVEASARRERLLHRALDAWHDKFATRVLIPPHNAITPSLASQIARRGFLVSRSITDAEVAAPGLDPQAAESRTIAKRLPWRMTGGGADYFQTIGLSRRYVTRSRRPPSEVAMDLVQAAEQAGNATVTFHWWDFASPGDNMMLAYAAETLDVVSRAATFTTISDFTARTKQAWPRD